MGLVIDPDNVGKIELLRTITGHKGAVNTLAFSPDGNRLITGGADGMVNIWQVRDGKLLFSLKGHTKAVNSVAFSRDGKTAASGSDDTTAILWSNEEGKKIWSMSHDGGVIYVGFKPDLQTSVTYSREGYARSSN